MTHTFCLLHGFGSSAQTFAPFKRALLRRWDRAVQPLEIITPEFAGFGKRANDPVSDDPFGTAIEDVVEALRDKEKVTLIAHSMGGIPALHVASWFHSKYPGRLQNVVLIEGNLVAEDCGDIARRFRDAQSRSSLKNTRDNLGMSMLQKSENSARHWGASLMNTQPETLQKYAGPLIDASENGNLSLLFKGLQDSGLPMTYIHGDNKVGHPVLEALTGHSDVEYDTVHVANAGHFVHEDQTQTFVDHVMERVAA
ncbi:MAG: alpha/beta fold hydrolase [Bdellovibrionales bacterium]